MTWVVDASVALKWVLPEEDSDDAHTLLRQPLIAPAWWLVEAGNGLWKSAQRGEITPGEAVALLDDLKEVPVTTVDGTELLGSALALASALGHPIYDCLYLALAIDRDLGLVTADTRFWRAVQSSPEWSARVVKLADQDWR